MTDSPIHTLAAYLRDSGGDAQDLSTAQQEAALRAWSVQNGFAITHWFKDEARPGSSVVGREGFLSMMDYFRRGGCTEEGVVIWKMSRFSRDMNDAAFYRADLRRRGYKVLSINDNIPDGPEGRFFEAAIDWMNERFLSDLSRDVKRGLAHLVLTYGAMPGTPPRGFVRQPVELPGRRDGQPHIAHRWVPDPDTIPLVRQAFELRAAGRSLAEINQVTHLYGSLNSYTTFFANRIYIGILEFGDQVIPDYCAPIIDQATWDSVQLLVRQHSAHSNLSPDNGRGNPRHPRRDGSKYLLSGLAYCARCGSPLFGAGASQRSSRTYDRYACSAAVRRRDCDLKPIPRAALETAVLATVAEAITTESLAEIQSLILHGQARQAAELEQQIAALRPRLANVRRRISNVTAAIADAGPGRALTAKLHQLELDESEALAEQSRLTDQSAAPPANFTLGQLQILAANLRQNLASQDPETVRRLLHGFVARISVDRDGAQILGQIICHNPIPDG
jgi:DNA invertase Pin-like site-specific DNA recombinase